jgi:hypothetical protein
MPRPTKVRHRYGFRVLDRCDRESQPYVLDFPGPLLDQIMSRSESGLGAGCFLTSLESVVIGLRFGIGPQSKVGGGSDVPAAFLIWMGFE